jgi:uncharacterized protein (DUF302 family)
MAKYLAYPLWVNMNHGVIPMHKISSAQDTGNIIANIKKILIDKNIKLFAIYDHAYEAREVGLELPETTVIVFGDPKIGTLLMQEDIQIALDLPLKFLVWEEDGKTWIGYHLPSLLSETFNSVKQKDILMKMDGLLANIAEMATQ